ncbi:hypothetical protein C2G38_2189801 [Gigaspora rosea]|uniref:Uncharacterized protein n=1 Tax=Gigaspora rosea TaxID=44941 RepID=A0A397V942_9GLOM|nr:hypothetical protein C2G38_2189801 [Gigaspora rosea]
MADKKSLYRLRQNKNDLIASIEYLALISSYIERLKRLSQVLTRFRVRDTDKTILINSMKSTWSLVKELNSADEFIKYLLENLIERDLTNLINGKYLFTLDDQSDTKLLQENTVAALIEVNKALNPLNKNATRLSTTPFLKCLSEVS